MTTPTNIPTGPHPTPGFTSEDAAACGTRPRRRNIGRILALLSIAACSVWAFMPLGPAQVDVPEISASAATARPSIPEALDLAAFNAPLWIAPAPPPPTIAEAPPPPSPPLKWQLLAIVREDSGYKALIYDPDTDRLLVLREGDDSGPQRIDRITATTMEVRGGDGMRTIALRDAAPGGRP